MSSIARRLTPLQQQRHRQVGARALTMVLLLWLVMVVLATVMNGLEGAVLVTGVVAIAVGVGAVLFGRTWWLLIGSRKVGTSVLVAGLVATVLSAPTAPAGAALAPGDAAASTSSTGFVVTTSPPGTSATSAVVLTSTAVTSSAASATTSGGLSPDQVDALITAAEPGSALAEVGVLAVKGRAPKTNYDRTLFGQAWLDVDRNGCDTRNDILGRDLMDAVFKAGTNDCKVLSGSLADPYTGRTITFVQGANTSDAVQIDHVVALSDAWQKGAQSWDAATLAAFANDPLNLLAVDGPTNQAKGDGDAATWLPPATSYRCAYVARQVAVKAKYDAWVTGPERTAIVGILSTCQDQPLPTATAASTAPTTAPTTTAASTAPTAAPTTAVPASSQVPVPSSAVTVESSAVPDAAVVVPAECVIKGNISKTGEKIYHLPGGQNYDDTVIDASTGERWFCSSADAEAAGWRASKR